MVAKDRKVIGVKNYSLILIAVSLIISGYLLMTGSSNDGDNFNQNIFSFRRITLAPIVLLAGYVLMIPAILWNRKNYGSYQKSHNGNI
jgi:hypothetical protein